MAVTLQVTIPDQHQARVVEAIEAYADTTIQMAVRVTDVDKWEWSYPERGVDTYKVWGENILRKFLVNIVKCYEYNKDVDRYNADVEAVTPPSESVPEDAIE